MALHLPLTPASRVPVIGSSGGIGSALVRALLDADVQVAAWDRARAFAESPAPAGCALIGELPAGDDWDAALAPVAEAWGALDGLVVTSGTGGARRPLAERSLDEIDAALAVNLRLPLAALRWAGPLLQRGRAASVVLLSSDMVASPQPGYAPYLAAKAALPTVAATLAREWAPAVRVNTVAPGAVDTPFLRGGRGEGVADQPLRFDPAAYLAQVPLARMATADDIVGPILFLLGPASAYMTGTTLHVSGGAVGV